MRGTPAASFALRRKLAPFIAHVARRVASKETSMLRTTLALAALLAVGLPGIASAAPTTVKHCRGANGRFVKCASAGSAMSKAPMTTASPMPKRSHHKKS